LELGTWNLEVGTWNLELGRWNLELGTWKMELGRWNLEVGTWNLELGSRNLELGTWKTNLSSSFRLRTKNEIINIKSTIINPKGMTINYLATKPERQSRNVSTRIADEIEHASYSIWIANIWITNNRIFELLIEKAKYGLNVEIILDKGIWMDCEDLHKLQKFIDAGGELYLTEEQEDMPSPEKAFCLIDNCVVIDHQFDDESYKRQGYSNYFMREYPETLVEHYINEYFSVKMNCCVNRYS
jgi:hypothetical protein